MKIVDSPKLKRKKLKAIADASAKRRALNQPAPASLPVFDAAVRCGVSEDVIYRLISEGKLGASESAKGRRNARGRLCKVMVSERAVMSALQKGRRS